MFGLDIFFRSYCKKKKKSLRKHKDKSQQEVSYGHFLSSNVTVTQSKSINGVWLWWHVVRHVSPTQKVKNLWVKRRLTVLKDKHIPGETTPYNNNLSISHCETGSHLENWPSHTTVYREKSTFLYTNPLEWWINRCPITVTTGGSNEPDSVS